MLQAHEKTRYNNFGTRLPKKIFFLMLSGKIKEHSFRVNYMPIYTRKIRKINLWLEYEVCISLHSFFFLKEKLHEK